MRKAISPTPGTPDPMPDSAPTPPSPPPLWLETGDDDRDDAVLRELALDEALLEEAHEGLRAEPVVRTWMAGRPAVVVGSSSRVEEEVDVAACRAAGVAIVRRPSGGATVLLGPGCLMWTVVSPFPEGVPPVERIHEAMLGPLAGGLVAEGIAASRRGTSDLVIDSTDGLRKVSGNALRVRRHGVLYHGTLLDAFDIPLAERLLRHPPREPDYRGRRPHGAFLANLGLGREWLEGFVRRAFGATEPYPAAAIPWPRVERLLAERYADAAWTHRL